MDVLDRVAAAYVAFLRAFPWEEPLAVRGAREGLTKFISNAYLASFPGARKYQLTQLISAAARERVAAGASGDLVFEHLVPKARVIQAPCEQRARAGQLTEEFVVGLLRKYWVLATVTAEEDRRLTRASMPVGWDGEDLLARYRAAGIELAPNPYVLRGVPPFEPVAGAAQRIVAADGAAQPA